MNMLSQKQKKWLNHLDDTNKIDIIPYDPKTKEVFSICKKDLIKALGRVKISHRGSTALKISGQGEVDLYIPATKKNFNNYLKRLVKHLGEPGSLYPFERARFVKYIDNIKIEIFLINKNNDGWKNSVKFEKYLKQNSDALNEYEKLKNDTKGVSTKKYYTAKTIFINKILKLASK